MVGQHLNFVAINPTSNATELARVIQKGEELDRPEVTKCILKIPALVNGKIDVSLLPSSEGPDPSKPTRFEWSQTEASDTWTVVHSLGYRYVDVLTLDNNGMQIIGQVLYAMATNNMIQILFSQPVSGRAIIRV